MFYTAIAHLKTEILRRWTVRVFVPSTKTCCIQALLVFSDENCKEGVTGMCRCNCIIRCIVLYFSIYCPLLGIMILLLKVVFKYKYVFILHSERQADKAFLVFLSQTKVRPPCPFSRSPPCQEFPFAEDFSPSEGIAVGRMHCRCSFRWEMSQFGISVG